MKYKEIFSNLSILLCNIYYYLKLQDKANNYAKDICNQEVSG